MNGSPDPRRYSAAVARNREPIPSTLRDEIPDNGNVLEIGSGSGEHALHFATALPGITWQPTDRDETALAGIDMHAKSENAQNIKPAVLLDVTSRPWPVDGPFDGIFCANVIHIAPWNVAKAIVETAASVLVPGAPLIFYGPFNRNGRSIAESNSAFDRTLRAENPDWGIRDLDLEIQPLAEETGFRVSACHEMPANNLTVVLR